MIEKIVYRENITPRSNMFSTMGKPMHEWANIAVVCYPMPPDVQQQYETFYQWCRDNLIYKWLIDDAFFDGTGEIWLYLEDDGDALLVRLRW